MTGSGKPVKIKATASKKRRVEPEVAEAVSVPAAPATSDAEQSVDPASDTVVDGTLPEEGGDSKPKATADVSLLIEQLKVDITASIAAMKAVAAKVRDLAKAHSKEKRLKASRKRKLATEVDVSVVEPKPEKLFDILEPLREFLGTPIGEKVGKKAARKQLSKYITENKLQDPDDHTLIKPDDRLAKLFGPPRFVTINKNVGYSNLNAQRYINDYFIVPPKVEAASSSSETEPVAQETVVA